MQWCLGVASGQAMVGMHGRKAHKPQEVERTLSLYTHSALNRIIGLLIQLIKRERIGMQP